MVRICLYQKQTILMVRVYCKLQYLFSSCQIKFCTKNFAQISDTNVKRKIYVTLRLDYFNPKTYTPLPLYDYNNCYLLKCHTKYLSKYLHTYVCVWWNWLIVAYNKHFLLAFNMSQRGTLKLATFESDKSTYTYIPSIDNLGVFTEGHNTI